MADQLNLFELFEEEFGSTAVAEVAPEPKKEAKKEKKSPSKKEEEKINLPITVYASSWTEEITSIDGKTEVTLDELKTYLISEGYVELKMSSSVVKKEEDKVVCGITNTPSYNNTPIVTEGTLTVASGQFTMELDTETSFEDSAKNIGAVADKWLEQYADYSEPKVIFDMVQNIGFPVAGEKKDKLAAGTYKAFYNGSTTDIEITEETEADVVVEKITGVKGGSIYLNSQNIVFPIIYRKAGKGSNSTSSSSAKTASKPVEEKKFKLPFTVTFTHTEDKLITIEQFPGKEEVTEKELQEYLLTLYEEYTADKTEFLYFKADNIVEARIKSAKRG